MIRNIVVVDIEVTGEFISKMHQFSVENPSILFFMKHYSCVDLLHYLPIIEKENQKAASFISKSISSDKIRQMLNLGVIDAVPLPDCEFKISNLSYFALEISQLGERFIEIKKLDNSYKCKCYPILISQLCDNQDSFDFSVVERRFNELNAIGNPVFLHEYLKDERKKNEEIKKCIITLDCDLTPELISTIHERSKKDPTLLFDFSTYQTLYLKSFLRHIQEHPDKTASSYSRFFEGDFRPGDIVRELITLGVVMPAPLPSGEFKISNLNLFSLKISKLGETYLGIAHLNRFMEADDVSMPLSDFLANKPRPCLSKQESTSINSKADELFKKKQAAILKIVHDPSLQEERLKKDELKHPKKSAAKEFELLLFVIVCIAIFVFLVLFILNILF